MGHSPRQEAMVVIPRAHRRQTLRLEQGVEGEADLTLREDRCVTERDKSARATFSPGDSVPLVRRILQGET